MRPIQNSTLKNSNNKTVQEIVSLEERRIKCKERRRGARRGKETTVFTENESDYRESREI